MITQLKKNEIKIKKKLKNIKTKIIKYIRKCSVY